MVDTSNHPTPGTLIGEPYAGTHSRAFNQAGGSDNWQSENAVDVWLFPGTAITACANGTISPGRYGYGLLATSGRFAGYRLHLITGDGKAFFYTHMSSLAVGQGATVHAGQVIGHSGIANGVPHLHFAARPPFDPRSFYKAAYNLKLPRSQVGVPPAAPPQPGQGPPALDDGDVNSAWYALMHALGSTTPAASQHIRDARHGLAQSVA